MSDRWFEIDEYILEHRIVHAIEALREEFGHSIPEALDALNKRYAQLRKSRPDEFTVAPDEYGRGVYT